MPESGLSGSVRGVPSNGHPYRDWLLRLLARQPACSRMRVEGAATSAHAFNTPWDIAPIGSALCIGGENACPPEDVGGAPGYAECLEALPNPGHPEHEHQLERIGGSFDPKAFDIDDVNGRLTQPDS